MSTWRPTWREYRRKEVLESLRSHKQEHTDCIYCPNDYDFTWLKKHVKSCGKNKYHCPYCNEYFFRWKNLYCHLHVHEKPFLCKLCNKKFDKKLSLRWHLTYKHF